jgi:type IV pilus assembly protein PilM
MAQRQGIITAMKFFGSSSGFGNGTRALSKGVTRWFPTPRLLLPRAAGIDISDSSIKWLSLAPESAGYRIDSWGEEPLQSGVVVNGAIQDVQALALALGKVKARLPGIHCAHAALPEEAAYVFSMHVPEETSREQTLRMIEFEFEGRVPIAPNASVYDFDVILKHDDGEGQEIAVAVFPRELAQSYTAAFDAAGITLLSLELEARSIARAVSSRAPDEPITLLVDFGRARTGFAVLKRGIPIFTSTVEVGGDALTHALMEKQSLSEGEVEVFKNEQGLLPESSAKSSGADPVTPVASALADEVARHYHYWDTRRNERGERVTPVSHVLLVGGSANLKGLTDFIAARVQAPAEIGDVWRHVYDFDQSIPPISRRRSLQYATATGLALRGI